MEYNFGGHRVCEVNIKIVNKHVVMVFYDRQIHI
jgi:hypothetical protein